MAWAALKRAWGARHVRMPSRGHIRQHKLREQGASVSTPFE